MALQDGQLTGLIIGAAIEVHRVLGPGFLECVYENALVLELRKREICVAEQVEVPVMYDGAQVGLHRLDLLAEGRVVVELKAIKELDDVHFAVVRSYLRAIGQKHGLLLNFAKSTLEVKRVISHASTATAF